MKTTGREGRGRGGSESRRRERGRAYSFSMCMGGGESPESLKSQRIEEKRWKWTFSRGKDTTNSNVKGMKKKDLVLDTMGVT